MYRSTCRLLFALAVSVTSIACGEEAPPPRPAYEIPSAFELEVTAERREDGGIVFVGKTNLPDGMKLGISLHDPSGKGPLRGQDYDIFTRKGKFRSQPFSDKGKPLAEGPWTVELISHLYEPWQTEEVLRDLGRYGSKLEGDGRGLFVASDADVPDPHWSIDSDLTVEFPPVPMGPKLIEQVKASKHTKKCQKGEGKRSVGEAIAIIDPRSEGRWKVNEDVSPPRVIWQTWSKSGERFDHKWEVDGRTVNYLNKGAKTVSCFPNGD